MGILNFTGWESGDSSEAQSVTGTTSVQSSVTRSGAYALRVNPTTSANGNHRFAKHSAAGVPTTSFGVSTLYHRFYFRIATAPSADEEEMYVVLDTGGSYKCYLTLNSSRNIKAYNNASSLIATGSTVLSTNTWYRIELQTSTGSGNTTFILKIDGADEINTTANQLTDNHGSVRLGKHTNLNARSIDFYYDDAAWSDSAFIGAGQCLKMAPDSNGSTAQWTGGTNSSDYAEVDEIPTDGDTTYIRSTGSAGDVHLVGLVSTTTAGISGTINAVKAWARIRENTDVTTATRVRVRSSSTNNDTSSSDPTTTYANRFNLLLTDPATSSAWTTSGLDSVEIGVKEDNAVQTRCTTLCLFVDFIPSSGVTSNIPEGSIVIAKQNPTTTLTAHFVSRPTSGVIYLNKQDPTTTLTDHKRSDVPNAAINLNAQAPTTTLTANFVSRPPAGSIILSAQNPTTSMTAHHVTRAEAGSIFLQKQNPTTSISVSVVIVPNATVHIEPKTPTTNLTQNFVSRPTSAQIVLTAYAPTDNLTGHFISRPPSIQVLLDPNDPTTTITGHFVSRPTAGQIHIHGRAPTTEVTSGLLAEIPYGEIEINKQDPTTQLTLNFLSRVPSGSILINAQAPTTVVTNGFLSRPPSAQINVIPQAPTTNLTQNFTSRPPSGSVVFQAYNPSTNVTQHIVSTISSASIQIEAQAPITQGTLRGSPLYTFYPKTLKNSFISASLPSIFESRAVKRAFTA